MQLFAARGNLKGGRAGEAEVHQHHPLICPPFREPVLFYWPRNDGRSAQINPPPKKKTLCKVQICCRGSAALLTWFCCERLAGEQSWRVRINNSSTLFTVILKHAYISRFKPKRSFLHTCSPQMFFFLGGWGGCATAKKYCLYYRCGGQNGNHVVEKSDCMGFWACMMVQTKHGVVVESLRLTRSIRIISPDVWSVTLPRGLAGLCTCFSLCFLFMSGAKWPGYNGAGMLNGGRGRSRVTGWRRSNKHTLCILLFAPTAISTDGLIYLQVVCV